MTPWRVDSKTLAHEILLACAQGGRARLCTALHTGHGRGGAAGLDCRPPAAPHANSQASPRYDRALEFLAATTSRNKLTRTDTLYDMHMESHLYLEAHAPPQHALQALAAISGIGGQVFTAALEAFASCTEREQKQASLFVCLLASRPRHAPPQRQFTHVDSQHVPFCGFATVLASKHVPDGRCRLRDVGHSLA